uniref:Calnexin n=1 Tax=Aureoumbra lagunensis TaxID=44058 RepID=A0A7S3NM33_9STRA|mmetsp:Transcript_18056/g.23547  ORF Transcript_18056/g.23547 Transcript_18056/m.23547 type:complete len:501 (+) Transcript_18056:45-1547(+)
MWRSCLLLLVSHVVCGELAFQVDFDNGAMSPFVLSSNERYAGQKVSVNTGALVLEEANHFYGIGAPVIPAFKDDTLVVQFEVTLTDGLNCGGAYIKLLEATSSLDVQAFDDKTPFVLMFGPDKCGMTDKVHFIVRQQNKISGEWIEHHLKDGPKAKTNKKAHLYTAIISKDDSIEILIDGDSVFTGNLMESLDPPLTPPTEIDDPNDSKPEDWVDKPKIPDPDATKPDDWDEDAPRTIEDPDAEKPQGWLDDEPALIPDPQAERPEDWDDDEDGIWEAPEISNPKCTIGCGEWTRPIISNPNYKGKWSPPMIDNPAYKGEWAPRKIPNPNYHSVQNPAQNLSPIGAYVVDVWTTNKGITFDSFALGANPDDASDFSKSFFEKKDLEEVLEQQKKEEKKQKKLQERLESASPFAKTYIEYIEPYLNPAIESVKAAPVYAFTTFCVALFTMWLLYSTSYLHKKTKTETATAESADDTAKEDKKKEEEEEEEEEREKPPMDDD